MNICLAVFEMNHHLRDLAHAGLYLLCLALLLVAGVNGAAFALRQAAPVVVAAADALDSDPLDTSLLSVNVATAREIRQALSRPIPRPAKLEPITAKLAFGHLKPGGKHSIASARERHKDASAAKRIPKEAMDAMAMDTSRQAAPVHFQQQHHAVTPELHKVY
jgi:hypothetical protein